MSMKKRAAQFAPFAAMEGYKESIEESIRQNEKLYEPKFDDGCYRNGDPREWHQRF